MRESHNKACGVVKNWVERRTLWTFLPEIVAMVLEAMEMFKNCMLADVASTGLAAGDLVTSVFSHACRQDEAAGVKVQGIKGRCNKE